MSRVVMEIDSSSAPWSAIRRRHRLVLPAPEGLATIRRTPRRGVRSFDILDLLPQLFDHGLEVEADSGERGGSRFRAEGVRLPHEFLHQEVEFPPGGGLLQQGAGGGDVGREAVELLA